MSFALSHLEADPPDDLRRALIDGLACAPLACADGTIRIVRRRLPWTAADGDRVAILRQRTIHEYGARMRPPPRAPGRVGPDGAVG